MVLTPKTAVAFWLRIVCALVAFPLTSPVALAQPDDADDPYARLYAQIGAPGAIKTASPEEAPAGEPDLMLPDAYASGSYALPPPLVAATDPLPAPEYRYYLPAEEEEKKPEDPVLNTTTVLYESPPLTIKRKKVYSLKQPPEVTPAVPPPAALAELAPAQGSDTPASSALIALPPVFESHDVPQLRKRKQDSADSRHDHVDAPAPSTALPPPASLGMESPPAAATSGLPPPDAIRRWTPAEEPQAGYQPQDIDKKWSLLDESPLEKSQPAAARPVAAMPPATEPPVVEAVPVAPPPVAAAAPPAEPIPVPALPPVAEVEPPIPDLAGFPPPEAIRRWSPSDTTAPVVLPPPPEAVPPPAPVSETAHGIPAQTDPVVPTPLVEPPPTTLTADMSAPAQPAPPNEEWTPLPPAASPPATIPPPAPSASEALNAVNPATTEPKPQLSPETEDILKKIPGNIDADKHKKTDTPVDIARVKEVPNIFTKDGQNAASIRHEGLGIDIQVTRPALDANYELQRAYEAAAAGHSEHAIEIYKMILDNDSKNTHALFGLATLYHRVGQIERARPYYSKLLSVAPDHRDGLNNFLVLLADEAPEAAIEQLLKLEARNPMFSPIPAQLAVIYNKLGDTDRATAKMLRAIELAPENITYRYNLAIMMDKQKNYDEAGRLYRQVLEAYYRGETIPGNIQKIQQRLTFISSNKQRGKPAL